MPVSDEEARRLLRDAIRSVEEDYRGRGIFQDRFGFGRSPALVVVDFAYGWTDEAYAGGSRRLDGPVEATRRLLDAARAGAVPIVYTTSPWRPESGDQPFKSAADRSPGFRAWDERACRIDERVAPHPRRPGPGEGERQRVLRDAPGPVPDRPRRRYPADHRVQHERLHPRDGHGREELPLPADRRPRVRRGPLAGRPRVDPVRHPGPVRRRRAAGRSPGLRIEPGCAVDDHESPTAHRPDGRVARDSRPPASSKKISIYKIVRYRYRRVPTRRLERLRPSRLIPAGGGRRPGRRTGPSGSDRRRRPPARPS